MLLMFPRGAGLPLSDAASVRVSDIDGQRMETRVVKGIRACMRNRNGAPLPGLSGRADAGDRNI